MFKSIKLMSRETKILLFGILLTNISTFMLSPFLTLYLNSRAVPVSQIALILSSNLVCQQGMTFFGGLIGDKIGYKKTLAVGICLRIMGYITYVNASGFLLFMLASSVVGIGGALITPTTKAAIASSEKEHRGEAFALRNVAVNIGAAIGPMLGGLLYQTSFSIVFIMAAMTYSVFLILNILYVNNYTYTTQKNIVKDFKVIILDSYIVKFTMITALFWFLYSQLSLTIPLYAKDFLKNESISGYMFSVNGILVIALQYYLLRYFEKKFGYKNILFSGMIMIALAFAMLVVFRSSYSLIVFIVLFTFGEILIGPTIDNYASTLAPDKSYLGGYLGFVSLGWAIGGVIGNAFGSKIYNEISKAQNYPILWILYIGIGILGAMLFLFFKEKKPKEEIAN